jgi:nitrite reductase/ring-hydroxylating ferredoxin subunit
MSSTAVMRDEPDTTLAQSGPPAPDTEWWAVAHLDELPEVGRYVARQVGSLWVVVVRDGRDSVRVLENSCPHQAMPICVSPGRGKVRTFQCPFHGWAFALDGGCLPPAVPRRPDHVARHSALARSRSLRSYDTTMFGRIVFAALPRADARGREPASGPTAEPSTPGLLAAFGHPGAPDVSQVRTHRFWRPVYDGLLAAFERVRPLAVNAFASVQDDGSHLVCAVIPRSSDGCTVTLVRASPGASCPPGPAADTERVGRR